LVAAADLVAVALQVNQEVLVAVLVLVLELAQPLAEQVMVILEQLDQHNKVIQVVVV
jgi:predicted permease